MIDSGEGDWGDYPDGASARRATVTLTSEFNAMPDVVPLEPGDLTVISSEEWCANNEPPCYHDRNAAILAALRQTPDWTYDFPPEPNHIFRLDGKRVPRWRMTSFLSTDDMATIWPFEGHPVALPHWEYNRIIMQSDLCGCTTHAHRKKGCLIGPTGRRCHICGALYTEYGNAFSYCLPCDAWKSARELYLALYAAEKVPQATVTAQLVLV